jgi:hypothetical protein
LAAVEAGAAEAEICSIAARRGLRRPGRSGSRPRRIAGDSTVRLLPWEAMNEKQIALETAAFLDSDAARRCGPRADAKRVVERYVEACYEGLGKAPWLVDGEDVRMLLVEQLPARMERADALAEIALDVIEAFYDHLATTRVVTQAFEIRQALAQHGEEFAQVVKSGRMANLAAKTAAPFIHKADKVGRNDPCSCGSGKKYKKCHGKDA